MRKQVEYAFRLLRVSAVDPTAGRAELEGMVNSYIDAGWELFKAETISYEANTVYIAYHFVKYEDAPVAAKK